MVLAACGVGLLGMFSSLSFLVFFQNLHNKYLIFLSEKEMDGKSRGSRLPLASSEGEAEGRQTDTSIITEAAHPLRVIEPLWSSISWWGE